MEEGSKEEAIPERSFDVNQFLDFSMEGTYDLEWLNKFLQLDEDAWLAADN